MNRIIALIFFFTLFFNGVSQNTIYIEYKCTMVSDTLKKIIKSQKLDSMPELRSAYRNMIEESTPIYFDLKIAGSRSLFSLSEDLESDRKKMNMNKILYARAIFYKDLENNIHIKQTKSFGELFVIDLKEQKLNWKITSEKKKIGKFICYKAIVKDYYKSDRNDNFKYIIAWFVPSLNYPFGPLSYSGLPGLIIDLYIKDGKYENRFVMTKISFNKKKYKFKIPNKGKFVTLKEFNEIGYKAINQLRRK